MRRFQTSILKNEVESFVVFCRTTMEWDVQNLGVAIYDNNRVMVSFPLNVTEADVFAAYNIWKEDCLTTAPG